MEASVLARVQQLLASELKSSLADMKASILETLGDAVAQLQVQVKKCRDRLLRVDLKLEETLGRVEACERDLADPGLGDPGSRSPPDLLGCLADRVGLLEKRLDLADFARPVQSLEAALKGLALQQQDSRKQLASLHKSLFFLQQKQRPLAGAPGQSLQEKVEELKRQLAGPLAERLGQIEHQLAQLSRGSPSSKPPLDSQRTPRQAEVKQQAQSDRQAILENLKPSHRSESSNAQVSVRHSFSLTMDEGDVTLYLDEDGYLKKKSGEPLRDDAGQKVGLTSEHIAALKLSNQYFEVPANK